MERAVSGGVQTAAIEIEEGEDAMEVDGEASDGMGWDSEEREGEAGGEEGCVGGVAKTHTSPLHSYAAHCKAAR